MEKIQKAIDDRNAEINKLLMKVEFVKDEIFDKQSARRSLKSDINTLRRREAAVMSKVDELNKIVNSLEIANKVVSDDINGI